MESLAKVPKLYIWLNRALYLGTSYYRLRKYTVTSDQLIVCLAGELVLEADDGSRIPCRSMLLRAGTEVDMSRVDASTAVVAFCYLDPIGQDYWAIREMMQSHEGDNSGDHRNEAELIETLLHIRDARLPSAEAFELVEKLIFPPTLDRSRLPVCDPRIVQTVQMIKLTVRQNLPVSDLARAVHLSESRLVKLFKNEMGIPVTKYRLRYRLLVGVIYLSLNYSITEAALAAGFASTAHFSKCFAATMGTQPSAAFLTPPFVEITLSEQILQAIADRSKVPLNESA